jgi:hypothetical protein
MHESRIKSARSGPKINLTHTDTESAGFQLILFWHNPRRIHGADFATTIKYKASWPHIATRRILEIEGRRPYSVPDGRQIGFDCSCWDRIFAVMLAAASMSLCLQGSTLSVSCFRYELRMCFERMEWTIGMRALSRLWICQTTFKTITMIILELNVC